MNQEKIQDLKDSHHAKIVIEWFNEEIKQMSILANHNSWDEVLGKKYAERILTKLIRTLESKPNITKKNQYK